jgi:hypothetical protein
MPVYEVATCDGATTESTKHEAEDVYEALGEVAENISSYVWEYIHRNDRENVDWKWSLHGENVENPNDCARTTLYTCYEDGLYTVRASHPKVNEYCEIEDDREVQEEEAEDEEE